MELLAIDCNRDTDAWIAPCVGECIVAYFIIQRDDYERALHRIRLRQIKVGKVYFQ